MRRLQDLCESKTAIVGQNSVKTNDRGLVDEKARDGHVEIPEVVDGLPMSLSHAAIDDRNRCP